MEIFGPDKMLIEATKIVADISTPRPDKRCITEDHVRIKLG